MVDVSELEENFRNESDQLSIEQQQETDKAFNAAFDEVVKKSVVATKRTTSEAHIEYYKGKSYQESGMLNPKQLKFTYPQGYESSFKHSLTHFKKPLDQPAPIIQKICQPFQSTHLKFIATDRGQKKVEFQLDKANPDLKTVALRFLGTINVTFGTQQLKELKDELKKEWDAAA